MSTLRRGYPVFNLNLTVNENTQINYMISKWQFRHGNSFLLFILVAVMMYFIEQYTNNKIKV